MDVGETARRSVMVLAFVLPSLGGAAPVVRDVPAPQGIVLKGGTLQLDFADAQFGFETANLDRVDELVWSGGDGELATTNFIVESGDNPASTDPEDFFGESLGVPLSITGRADAPFIIDNGYASVASHRTSTTLTTTTTGLDFRGNATNAPTASTVYTVYPAGNPNQNEFRVSRTINFSSSTQIYPSSGVRVYMPYVANIFAIVLYPSTGGAIKSLDSSQCNLICPVTDWTGQWFADDADGDGGMMVIRDASSLAPAQLVVAFEEESLGNLTSIALVQPTNGFQAPVTETEWVCFYDRTTWSSEAQQAGQFPQGCAQNDQALPDVTPDAFSFTPKTGVAPNSLQTSNTITITGINAATSISVSGGSYSINGAAYSSAAGSVSPADTVTVQGLASASYSTATSVLLTVGGVGGTFGITTKSEPLATVTSGSGHIGGGGALGCGSLYALLALVLLARTRSAARSPSPSMARLLSAFLLAATATSPVSAEEQAQSPSPYVGIRAGIADYQFSPGDLENRLGSSGSGFDTAAISSRQFGGMLYGGVPIYRNLMLELSYAQLGQFPISTKTNSADPKALAQRILGQLAPAGHGLTAGFALPLQIGSLIAIEPRLSALYYQSKQEIGLAGTDYTNDLRGVGLDAGLSTTLRLLRPLYVGFGVDCFHMTQACNVLLYSAQIEYRFGHH